MGHMGQGLSRQKCAVSGLEGRTGDLVREEALHYAVGGGAVEGWLSGVEIGGAKEGWLSSDEVVEEPLSSEEAVEEALSTEEAVEVLCCVEGSGAVEEAVEEALST